MPVILRTGLRGRSRRGGRAALRLEPERGRAVTRFGVKLGQILVVDDCDADLLHARGVLEDAEVAESVVPFSVAMDALAFLQRPEGHDVDVILLDIDMPDMASFEFLLAYERLHPSQRARVLIAMLTATMDARDQTRAIGFGCVRQQLVKPLAAEQVRDLLPLVARLPAARYV